jgi:methylmalonyl-CoA epimerase
VVRTVGTTGEGVGELLEVVRRVAGGKVAVPQRLMPRGAGEVDGIRSTTLRTGSEAVLLSETGVLATEEVVGAIPTSQKRDVGHPTLSQGRDVGHPTLSQGRDVGHPTLSQGRDFSSPGSSAGLFSGEGLGLDHLGIAVKGIDAARGFYEGLGLRVDAAETVEHEGVRVAMISLRESRIELLEALSEDTVIGRFLAKRGEGLHHVALRVAGIDAMFERLKAQGVRLVSDRVRVGAGGHRYFFVHPASTGGVLMELVEGGK